MLLAAPDMIPKIDRYAEDKLGISTRELMRRAGEAVANAVSSLIDKGARVLIFAGKGNNGGDGYAAAQLLMADYDVSVYDVFAAGQRSDAGRFFRDSYLADGGRIFPLELNGDILVSIDSADCVVDAVFGTGFVGEYPKEAIWLAKALAHAHSPKKIALDVPLGVDAGDGRVHAGIAYRADVTVTLGFIKPGLVSYPAKEYVGTLIYDNIGLQNDAVLLDFEFDSFLIDYALASSFIPQRNQNSNKGSFGKLLSITGSSDFPGAARLSLEAALRSGVGLCTYLGEKTLCDSLLCSFPEVIYKPSSIGTLSENEIKDILSLAHRHTAVLVGSGSGKKSGLFAILEALLLSEGAPIVLDADAINVLADGSERGRELLRRAKRTVILTPHPLELSRISGIPTDDIQANRLSFAKSFASENNCILVLKGAATVVTDGREVYINSSGSSALAKAGSGDVLAGMLASVVASGVLPIRAAALSVYFHGLAADVLADELSELGVTPSDLPSEIARQLAKAEKRMEKNL